LPISNGQLPAEKPAADPVELSQIGDRKSAIDNQYNGFVAEAKPFRLTESVKAAG